MAFSNQKSYIIVNLFWSRYLLSDRIHLSIVVSSHRFQLDIDSYNSWTTNNIYLSSNFGKAVRHIHNPTTCLDSQASCKYMYKFFFLHKVSHDNNFSCQFINFWNCMPSRSSALAVLSNTSTFMDTETVSLWANFV